MAVIVATESLVRDVGLQCRETKYCPTITLDNEAHGILAQVTHTIKQNNGMLVSLSHRALLVPALVWLRTINQPE